MALNTVTFSTNEDSQGCNGNRGRFSLVFSPDNSLQVIDVTVFTTVNPNHLRL